MLVLDGGGGGGDLCTPRVRDCSCKISNSIEDGRFMAQVFSKDGCPDVACSEYCTSIIAVQYNVTRSEA